MSYESVTDNDDLYILYNRFLELLNSNKVSLSKEIRFNEFKKFAHRFTSSK